LVDQTGRLQFNTDSIQRADTICFICLIIQPRRSAAGLDARWRLPLYPLKFLYHSTIDENRHDGNQGTASRQTAGKILLAKCRRCR